MHSAVNIKYLFEVWQKPTLIEKKQLRVMVQDRLFSVQKESKNKINKRPFRINNTINKFSLLERKAKN